MTDMSLIVTKKDIVIVEGTHEGKQECRIGFESSVDPLSSR